jgi:hypothetical protein
VHQNLYAVEGEQGSVIVLEPGVYQHAEASQVARTVHTQRNVIPVGTIKRQFLVCGLSVTSAHLGECMKIIDVFNERFERPVS